MNEKNFEYLRDQVKYSGFGESMEAPLKENLKRQTPEFTLQHQAAFGKDEAVTSLHFKKSATTDMYFFNSYMVSLKQEQQDQKMNQTFYIGRDNNVTLKEGYNLMSGRAVNKDLVNKDGQRYNAWMELDFKDSDDKGNFKVKQYHQNYGFDLEKQLSKLPIKEIADGEGKTKLIESLQKGNRQSVTFVENGSEQRRFIEANPRFKNITVYDLQMQRVSNRQAQENAQGQSQKNSKQQSTAQKSGIDDDSKPEKKTRKSKQQGISR